MTKPYIYQYEDEPLLSPQPYTYCIRHLLSNKRYYGASVGRWSNPYKLLHTYLPQSKAVQNLIERDGVKSFVIEELQLWDTPDEAMAWKKNVLTTVDASSSELWLNEHNGQGHTAECLKKLSESTKIIYGGLRKMFLTLNKSKELLRGRQTLSSS